MSKAEPSSTWSTYVQNLLDERGWSGVDFENASGISRTRLVSWRKGQSVSPEAVRATAAAFGVPVIQAFVAAGFLTAEEARQQASAPVAPAELSNRQLLAELERRLNSPEQVFDGESGNARLVRKPKRADQRKPSRSRGQRAVDGETA